MCKAIIGTLSVEFVSDVSLKIHQITKDSTIVNICLDKLDMFILKCVAFTYRFKYFGNEKCLCFYCYL